jgi:hypothetical protein
LQGTNDALGGSENSRDNFGTLSGVASSHPIEFADHSFLFRRVGQDAQVLQEVLDTLAAWPGVAQGRNRMRQSLL